VARDSTAIQAREHYPETPAQAAERKAVAAERKAARAAKRKADRAAAEAAGKPTGRGPQKRYQGGKRPPTRDDSDKRLQRQRSMKLPEMLADLPRQCDRGCKQEGQPRKPSLLAWLQNPLGCGRWSNSHQCGADVGLGT